MELKTTKALRSARDTELFEKHKLLKFWLQSFLANTPSVVVGFRDDAGRVQELKTYETKTIHRIVRPRGHWDPCVVFRFGKAVLEWLLELCGRDAAGPARFVMRYDPAAAAVLLLPDEGEAPPPAGGADGESAAAKRRRTE